LIHHKKHKVTQRKANYLGPLCYFLVNRLRNHEDLMKSSTTNPLAPSLPYVASPVHSPGDRTRGAAMTFVRFGLVLMLLCVLDVRMVVASTEEDDYTITEPQQTTERGFPWLCFATSIVGMAGMVGMIIVVRRRELKEEAEIKSGRKKKEIPWYCRACDRDVVGSECSRCHALSPFDHDVV
jgi:hypothetical protein